MRDHAESPLAQKLTPEQLKFYSDEGYLALGKVLSDDALSRISEELIRAWREEHSAHAADQTWLQNHLSFLIHRKSHAQAIRKFFYNGPLVDAAEQLIGPNIQATATMASIKVANSPQGVGWHQDNGYGELDPYNSMSAIVSLVKATEQNGCLWVVPRSHRRGQISTGMTLVAKRAGIEADLQVDDASAVALPMEPGECVIFHALTFHKSNGNHTNEDRVFFFLRYADADTVEVYNDRKPRLGKVVRGSSRFPEIAAYESDLT